VNDESFRCPGCGGQIGLQEKKCPLCGRWMAARGISFYVFWIALSLLVAVLLAQIFHTGFTMLNKML
jgi:hypothetical protein